VGREIQGQTGKPHTRTRVLATGEKLRELIREESIDEVFVALPGATTGRVRAVFAACREAGVGSRFVPRLHGMFFQEIEIDTLDGIPLVRQRTHDSRPIYEALKRIFDLAFSLAVLVAAAPVLAVLAWLVKRDTPGPALFVHERVGLQGKTFLMYKLRTMGVDTPTYEFHPKSVEDPRLTRVGRWLRRLSLDELPQFFNVLVGDMSVVGPRPEMPFIVARYNDQQRMRLRVKPGITGLWQISADRSRMIHENMDYDLFYVFNRGPLLDLVIVVETLFAVLRGFGAR
jgi:exopolysaccharide biosynthesis polyprenyl glycosylphosphotransferase